MSIIIVIPIILNLHFAERNLFDEKCVIKWSVKCLGFGNIIIVNIKKNQVFG